MTIRLINGKQCYAKIKLYHYSSFAQVVQGRLVTSKEVGKIQFSIFRLPSNDAAPELFLNDRFTAVSSSIVVLRCNKQHV